MPDELRMFVPVAIRDIAEGLAKRICSAAGASVARIVDLNPLIYRRLFAGEAFDIGLTNPSFVAALAAHGHIDGASHRPFGRVALALGRRKGSTPSPVVRDGAGVATLLSEAGTVVYVGAGTSGATYLGVLDRLGLGPAVGPRSIAMERGTVVPAVLSGAAELVAAPLTIVLAHPELEPAAILPEALGADIGLEIFVRANPPAGALGVLDFLMSADLDHELAAAGVLRPRPAG